ncbi:iron ABC transporter permease [Tsukamurella serpentis]
MTRSAPKTARTRLLWILGVPALVLLLALGVTFGSTDIAVGDVWRILFDRILGRPLIEGSQEIIIWRVRFPRPVLAALIGAGLGMVGAAVQAIVRNPLADPYLLGVSSGASLGAVATLVLGGSAALSAFSTVFALPMAAFLGAMAAFLVVWLVGARGAAVTPLKLILAGVAIGQIFASFTSFLVLQADDINLTQGILHWLMGSLAGAIGPAVPVVTVAVGAGAVALFALARPLNALMIGDETANSLGISPKRVRTEVFVVTSLMTGVMVAFSGAIGFIGLVIPHIARFLVGTDHRRLLPASALCGALLLLCVDLLCRLATRVINQELPINVVAAVIGAPTLLYLVSRHQRKAM